MRPQDSLLLVAALLIGSVVVIAVGAWSFFLDPTRTFHYLGLGVAIVGILLFAFGLGWGIPKLLDVCVRQPKRVLAESSFAEANSFDFTLSRSDTRAAHSGILFRLGQERVAFEVMRLRGAPFVEWGNYRFSTPTNRGKNSTPWAWGYLMIPVAKKIPNALLRLKSVKQMNSLSAVELPIAATSVEPFELRCSPEDRPAIDSLLGGHLLESLARQHFTAEIADGYLYLYRAELFALSKPETVASLARLATALTERFGTSQCRA
ncbi:hypothetical protein AX769_14935 [Frondihabitans sp. PAMC 28766]|uniref:hypothetical protein n=1 Tax=Frondihabitans sp. PAMC 28766 TaxID=1795630 RepID=UPI00078BCF31|nr:hypothetical protein [Frondihabitans sp. PAMC 28766]AMM21194.1 hypothetical protein AX769_14935 [Frondihabitans sp. PAMC 28766]